MLGTPEIPPLGFVELENDKNYLIFQNWEFAATFSEATTKSDKWGEKIAFFNIKVKYIVGNQFKWPLSSYSTSNNIPLLFDMHFRGKMSKIAKKRSIMVENWPKK